MCGFAHPPSRKFLFSKKTGASVVARSLREESCLTSFWNGSREADDARVAAAPATGARRLQARGLQGRIILLASLTVLPALVVLGGAQWIARRRALDRTIEESRRVTRLAAAEQASFFAGTERLLRTVSASHLPTDSATCGAILSDILAEHRLYLNLFIADGRGQVVCSAVRDAFTGTQADRPWFTRALATRRMAIGDFQISRVSGKPGVIVAIPRVDANGTVTRVFGATIELAQLSTTATTGRLASSSVLTVLDRNHTILLRLPDGERWVGKRAPGSGATDRIRRGAADDVRVDFGVDGIRRLWTTVPIDAGPDTGLTLALGIPDTIAFAEVNELFRESGWLLLLVVSATGTIAWIASERCVVRPLHILTDVTRRLSRGDFGARAELAGTAPAVRQLAESVNEMAIGLEQRGRAEEQLRMLGHAIASTDEMISVTDLEHRITFANRAFLEGYGYSLEEVLGQTRAMLRSPETTATVGDEILRATQAGGWRGELLNRRKDGTDLFISLNTSLIRNGEGQVIGMLGVARDISERRSLEHQLRQSQKMEAVGQLAGGIAHDFNNLLTVILGSTELLLEETTTAETSRELQQIRAAGSSAAALTRQLLAFSRKQVLQPCVVDLNEILTEIGSLVRRVIGEDLQFVTRLASGLDRVYVDRSQFEQVVLNLAVNARDAMPKGGTLTIETRNVAIDSAFVASHPGALAGAFVRLVISDTGVGMNESTMARVFEPFFTTKGPGKGTGLGLATVYGIVKQSGGYVCVESTPGVGSTFSIDLPRTTELLPSVVAASATSSRGDETVLLVEDEAAVRTIARRILTAKGYRVLEARSGREAIEMARAYRGSIHLLLTDVVMPATNGVDVATQVVMDHNETCVLFMSGYPNQELLRRPMKVKVGFVEKPFTPEALLHQVRALLAPATDLQGNSDAERLGGVPDAATIGLSVQQNRDGIEPVVQAV
jgi:PAS domain S-box-containing protein